MRFSAEDEAFRAEVRRFIRENLPDDVRRKVLAGMEVAKDDYMRWHRILHGKGWVAPNWPANEAAPAGTSCDATSSTTKPD